MLISNKPISNNPISDQGSSGFTASIVLTQGASSIFITDAEIFGAINAFQQPNSTISITGVFFVGSLTLTQPNSSINVNSYNGIAPWQAAPVDNTRRRQAAPTLQGIRQVAPTLKQIRQLLPMLGD